MPRATRALTRTIQRQTPYGTRPHSTSIDHSQNNMAAVVSPMMPYPYGSSQHGFYLEPSDTRYHYQSAYTMSTSMPAAPAVQTPIMSAPIAAYTLARTNTSQKWTEEMDEILLEYAQKLSWEIISSRYFNGERSGNACRKRHSRLKKERSEPSRWDDDKVMRVIEIYERRREQMFQLLASEIPEPWATWENLEKLVCIFQDMGMKADYISVIFKVTKL